MLDREIAKWPGLFSAVLDTMGALVIVLDTEGRIVLFNKACERTTGFAADEVIGKTGWDTLLAPGDVAPSRAAFDELRAGRFPTATERALCRKDGGPPRRIRWTNTALTGPDGAVQYVVATGIDVTDRERAAEALDEAEARARSIVETAVDGIVVIDERGTIESVNPAAERLFGYAARDMVGKNVSLLMPAPYRESHDDYISKYLRTGERKIIGIGREVVGLRKDGSTFPMWLSVGEVRIGGRRTFTGIVHDLSPFKQMQEELIRSRNLAAMGEMAAMVAHEVKNPLTAISGVVQVLRDEMPAKDPRRDVVAELLGEVRRLDDIVRHLLILAKPWIPKREPCRLRDVAERVAILAAEQKLLSRVRYRVDEESGVTAPVDPSLLEQVLWNLVQNAAEAMPGGGEIRVTFEERGGRAVVNVADSGTGMAPDVQDKMFRPFFTTKKDGNGLGLSICRKIMEAHGGTIRVYSAPGRGTTVALEFPMR